MGLGETQVFQDEKSRLANTTVARIVAAKGSLNDPETNGHRDGGASPGDLPGHLSARGRARLAPARPRPEHEPGDDRDRPSRRQTRQPFRRAASLRPKPPGEGYSY